MTRLLLTGDAAARPDGLERALTRAGFQLTEERDGEATPDAVLITLADADTAGLAAVLEDADESPPRIVLFAVADPEAAAAALGLGAADALAAPVHLPELCARIEARVRDRQSPVRTRYESQVRESLRQLVASARTTLQPDEVVLALVRRLARALELAHCSFVLLGEDQEPGRVVADFETGGNGNGPEPARLDPGRLPELVEAARTRRPVTLPEVPGPRAGKPPRTMVALPVTLDDAVVAVVLLAREATRPPLAAAQLELAGSLAEAAARSLHAAGGPGNGGSTRTGTALDRRLQEELERARRYSLGFSLVLLELDHGVAATAADDPAELERTRQELGARLRRELRLPDFLSRYGGSEFAIVLPETGADGARRSVRRLREHLPAVSAGVVAFPHPAVSAPDDLFALVEAALVRGRLQAGERIGVAE